MKAHFSFLEDDYIICADGGYRYAKAEGICPDIVIGDFDSMADEPVDSQVIRLQTEKDDTDTLVCLNHGIEKGFDTFVILGGLGGRLDHTIANLQVISHAIDKKKSIWIIDGKNRATMIDSGSLILEKEEDVKVSLFSFTEVCVGVNISGVKYPLRDHLLSQSFPLGISNEFVEDQAQIGVLAGKLLIILSQD